MVQVTVDTNNDTLEDLQHAIEIIQKAIARREGSPQIVPEAQMSPTAAELVEETAVDIPFMKITVSSDEPVDQPAGTTINELLSQESITEDELQELYKHVPEAKKTLDERQSDEEPKTIGDDSESSFIEIVDFEDDKP